MTQIKLEVVLDFENAEEEEGEMKEIPMDRNEFEVFMEKIIESGWLPGIEEYEQLFEGDVPQVIRYGATVHVESAEIVEED